MKQKALSSTTFGLIGHPLAHSFSKRFFTELFAAEGSPLSYDNFDLPELSPAALYTLLLLNPKLKGLNVTAPYKEQIIDYLDYTDPQAAEAGAVNTLVIVRGDDDRVVALKGYNTDIEAFGQCVEPLLSGMEAGSGAMILGTGGAAKAVAAAIRGRGRKCVFVSRSKRSADTVGYDSIDADLIERFPLIVNATPLGTWPNTDTCPPFPFELLGPANAAFDLVYNPSPSLFLRRAAQQGAATADGSEMLRLQALASLKIWTNS